METKQAQAEIEAALTAEANSETVMANLQKLKEMAEQGVITEEEFNQKKAEMMARIWDLLLQASCEYREKGDAWKHLLFVMPFGVQVK